MKPLGITLWSFSIERYGRPGVAEQCLRLQDDAGADVNFVLACLWCGQRGVTLDDNDMAALTSGEVAKWHDQVVRPLRAARRAMKQPPPGLSADAVETLRGRLKAVELESERFEQDLLQAALALPESPARTDEERSNAAFVNLTLYAATLRTGVPPEVLRDLVRICID